MDLVVVSNRGPLSFTRGPGGRLVGHEGAGGLVSSLGPLVASSGATWVAAAMNEGDRAAAAAGVIDAAGYRLVLLALDPEQYRMAYEDVSNATLWNLHHRLFDLARQPVVDAGWFEAWDAYRDVNRRFADAVAEVAPEGAAVLVQDYHLALVGATLTVARPDLRLVHFTHTPFCSPSELGILPPAVVAELLGGMAAHRACGFHTARWADAFERGCGAVLGRAPATFIAPLAPDIERLRKIAASEECSAAAERLDASYGERRLIVRVDRIEPSKNIVRGFLAYEDLLRRHPEWVERVTFLALEYPSRETLPGYVAYRREIESMVAEINDRWRRPGWEPIVLDVADDVARSVAALQNNDVLLVNPVRDGLNLVAKEGPLLNARDGVLVLSHEAGAWDELGGAALGVHPFDIRATADALAHALSMGPRERARHAAAVRAAAAARTPQDWLDDQLAAATR
ncbi:MAG TPA: trehalose-6-phosphate synthase [Acidimicrobiales bacterium]|nr:trehalose-6-phosphate synthase [Acidimicrobiales bacterium]